MGSRLNVGWLRVEYGDWLDVGFLLGETRLDVKGAGLPMGLREKARPRDERESE